METLRPTATARLPSSVPAAATGGYPGWVMLEPYATFEHEVDDSEYSNSGGVKITEVASRSSDGHVVRVSFRLDAPPAASQLTFHCSPCSSYEYGAHWPSMNVVAAHGDSVHASRDALREGRRSKKWSLIGIRVPSRTGCGEVAPASSCAAAATTTRSSWWRSSEEHRRDTLEGAELVVLRSGEWSATPIIHDDGKGEELSYWETDMAVPVGDRLLCYVDLYRGVILCDDEFDEAPHRLRYVSLPVEAPAGAFDDMYDRHGSNQRYSQITTRTVSAIDGGGAGVALRFVDIFPRCCCGSKGATYCDHSSNAFVINIWTVTIDDADDMAWTMDSMIDATELWSLDAYAGIPRNFPLYPIVSIDDPNLICLIVAEERKRGTDYGVGEMVWKIMMDTSSKVMVMVMVGAIGNSHMDALTFLSKSLTALLPM
uniref:DUF1618 domain-containing protein n=1 Tax=Oryza punctata TaxID=4537 RepID=A0A0E0MD16_ORYPU